MAGGRGGEQVEAGADAGHRLDAELAGVWRDACGVAVPDEDRAGARLELHVEAVLGPVIDDDVEGERFGDLPARSLDDVDVRQVVAVRDQPALRLQLRDVARARRPLGDEDDLPASFSRDLREPRDDARLGLLQRLPEVLGVANRLPEVVLLAAGQRSEPWRLGLSLFGSGSLFGGGPSSSRASLSDRPAAASPAARSLRTGPSPDPSGLSGVGASPKRRTQICSSAESRSAMQPSQSKAIRRDTLAAPYLMATSSISKISVAFGPMSTPAPRSP